MKPGSKLSNRYEVIRKIATGGMGELYLAESKGDNDFKRHVVIKRLHKELHSQDIYKDFFIQEAILSGKFHHPNIVQVYDMGKDEDGLFMVMEYILGKDLMSLVRKSISRKSFIPMNHALNIILQIGEGLSYVHSLKSDKGKPLGMVHRDVTPQNIIITLNGFAKLVDFGVAAVNGTGTSPGEGILPGKINYMAPELLKGHNPDKRADIFSLGVLLYELTVGKRLFKGTREKVRELITSGSFPVPTNIIKGFNPQLEQIILKSLENNPDFRYSNAGEMVSEIENFALENSMIISRSSMANYLKSLFVMETGHHVVDDEVEHEEIDLDLDINFLEEWNEEGAMGAELHNYDLEDLDDEKYFEIMANPDKLAEFKKTIQTDENDEISEDKSESENSDQHIDDDTPGDKSESENPDQLINDAPEDKSESENPDQHIDDAQEDKSKSENSDQPLESSSKEDKNNDNSTKSLKTEPNKKEKINKIESSKKKSKKEKTDHPTKQNLKKKNSDKDHNSSKDSGVKLTPGLLIGIISVSIAIGAVAVYILS
jgi:serine/threonine protein kinase